MGIREGLGWARAWRFGERDVRIEIKTASSYSRCIKSVLQAWDQIIFNDQLQVK